MIINIFCLSSGDIYLSLGILHHSHFQLSLNCFVTFFYNSLIIPLLQYFNLSSSVIPYLSSRNIYLSPGISLSSSFEIASELFCCEIFETLVTLLAILLPIRSPVTSSVF